MKALHGVRLRAGVQSRSFTDRNRLGGAFLALLSSPAILPKLLLGDSERKELGKRLCRDPFRN